MAKRYFSTAPVLNSFILSIKIKYKAIIIASLFLLSAIFFAHKQLLLAIGDFLVTQDNIQPADVIHVIAGPDYRTDYAIQLYKEGYGRLLFFTGGWCQTQNYFHGQHAQKRSIDQGVPIPAIAIDDFQVTSTYSEAVRLKEFINQSKVPIHSVIVISDPYCMRRTRWTYRQVLGDKLNIEMAPVPFELSPYHHYWWTSKDSKKLVKDEYLKIAYYYARYRFSWGPLKDWLVSLDRN